MNGPSQTPRQMMQSALATCVLLSSALVLPGLASADSSAQTSPLAVGSIAQAMGQERATLKTLGAARLAEIRRAGTQTPNGLGEGVTVGTRNVDAGAAVQLAAAAPRKLDIPAIDALPGVSGGAQWQCLAEAVYFESRGEPLDGQIAVAEVVLNRVDDRRYPNTVCGVTKQGVGNGRSCQFSYACDGNSDVMRAGAARDRSEKIASLMIAGRERNVTKGATHFHTRAIRPGWAGRLTRTAAIGHHLFYRSGTQVAQN